MVSSDRLAKVRGAYRQIIDTNRYYCCPGNITIFDACLVPLRVFSNTESSKMSATSCSTYETVQSALGANDVSVLKSCWADLMKKVDCVSESESTVEQLLDAMNSMDHSVSGNICAEIYIPKSVRDQKNQSCTAIRLIEMIYRFHYFRQNKCISIRIIKANRMRGIVRQYTHLECDSAMKFICIFLR